MHKIKDLLKDNVNNENFNQKSTSTLAYLKKTNVILYGVGESSHWFYEILMKRHNLKPEIALDRNYKHQNWEGIRVAHPDSVDKLNLDKVNSTVIVSVGSREVFSQIKDDLIKKGFRNIIYIHEIYEIHNLFSLPNIHDADEWNNYFINHLDQIEHAYNLLNDEKSKIIFENFLITHIQKKPVEILRDERNEQYFPKDVSLTKGYDVFVNCGSYDGDTIRLLNETIGKVKQIFCFEPEPHIFSKLSNFLLINKMNLADEIFCWPCALDENSKLDNFLCGDGLGSKIDKNGETRIQCVKIDDVLINVKPTFISMDVENFEINVLKGAKRTLTDYKPDLGICVYHSPSQIWEIPIFLDQLNIGYKFSLRNYTSFTTETVLYAH